MLANLSYFTLLRASPIAMPATPKPMSNRVAGSGALELSMMLLNSALWSMTDPSTILSAKL
jgi:hypothetical protein